MATRTWMFIMFVFCVMFHNIYQSPPNSPFPYCRYCCHVNPLRSTPYNNIQQHVSTSHPATVLGQYMHSCRLHVSWSTHCYWKHIWQCTRTMSACAPTRRSCTCMCPCMHTVAWYAHMRRVPCTLYCYCKYACTVITCCVTHTANMYIHTCITNAYFLEEWLIAGCTI